MGNILSKLSFVFCSLRGYHLNNSFNYVIFVVYLILKRRRKLRLMKPEYNWTIKIYFVKQAYSYIL